MKSFHEDCKRQHAEAINNIHAAISRAWNEDRVASVLPKLVDKFAADGRVHDSERHRAVMAGLGQLAETALDDRVLSRDEESRFMQLASGLGLASTDLQQAGISEPLAKAAVLRDLDEGLLKSRVQLEDIPVVLGRNESVLWAFPASTLMEYKTTSRTVGRSHGVSIRIMKGVYYRVGAFKGNRISETSLERTDQGICVLTSLNWFFWGAQRQVKMPLKSVLSVQGYSDAIEVTPTAASAKPKIFKVSDPEFAASALTRAASLAR